MIKKHKGFTLAEVLITLAIIGVAAALALPAITTNIQTAKTGPALSKFVNTFTLATKIMMSEHYLSQLNDNIYTDIVHLEDQIDMRPYAQSYIFYAGDKKSSTTLTTDASAKANLDRLKASMEDADDDTKENIAKQMSNTIVLYKQKDNSIIAIVPVPNPSILSDKGQYKGIVAEVLIDIDGDKSRNTAGRDVFAFLLDKSGALIPASSETHAYVETSGGRFITSYVDNCNISSNSLNNNFACTGKIADNGYNAKTIKWK